MRNTKVFGLSLPKEIMDWIDEERGDVNRSKFISRILEKELKSN
jgi:metal-responsive CopG/Arc/MetJ family transcriptional regulator